MSGEGVHALGAEFTTVTACRSCGAAPLISILSLGETPLANALVAAAAASTKPEPRYPLAVVRCGSCALVQLTVSVAPEILFRNYVYRSSFSDAFLAHAKEIAERTIVNRNWHGSRLVVEIASNDGYLLKNYRTHAIPVLGIEPARNIAQIAREQCGIDTIEDFFGRELAARLASEGRRADVIHANNVLAHVHDLNGVLGGIHTLLKQDGEAIIEVPYLLDMIDKIEFDTIYHEHLCYFSLTGLAAAFAREGLRIVDVEHLDVHGGSVRIFAHRTDAPGEPALSGVTRVAQMLAAEHHWGVADHGRYVRFAREVKSLKTKLVDLLRSLKAERHTIAAYGASAKGTTLLNFCGLGQGEIDYVVDRSTLKQGSLTPGTRLPIVPPERLLETRPDYVLLLVWNFAREVIAQQAEYREGGGRFIVPVPEPVVI
jgi:SAM-dependent methyltransferase